MQTIGRALAMWSLPVFPPDREKVQALGVILKAGGYRSAESYLSLYKAEAERRGYVWTALEQRATRDAVRSCLRGLGGPQKALPLPFSRLGELDGGHLPWTAAGPVGPRNMVVLGAWFMLREVEAANSRIKDVVVHVRDGRPKVVWTLPASKTDQQACGVSRSHGCMCEDKPSPSCPGHAAWAQASLLKRLFPHGNEEMPFFPTVDGKVCTKDAMASTLTMAAESLGVPAETATGKITGHTLRVTGAQGMAAAGLDLWAIQLIGEWCP